MFNIIGMFIIGLITGWLARWFYPGAVPIGFWMTGLLGIAGSFLGGFLVRIAKGKPATGQLDRAGLLMSIVGSILLLFIGRQLNLW